MQELYNSRILFLLIFVFIIPIVTSQQYDQDYLNPITYSKGDLRWCKLDGSNCVLGNITIGNQTNYYNYTIYNNTYYNYTTYNYGVSGGNETLIIANECGDAVCDTFIEASQHE